MLQQFDDEARELLRRAHGGEGRDDGEEEEEVTFAVPWSTKAYFLRRIGE